MSFLSFLKKVGQDFKKIFENPWTQKIEQVAGAVLTLAVPPIGSLFSATASAVMLAEQKAAALGKQDGSGPQKLADVLQLMEPVIAQALKDAGKDSSTAAVTNYINGVVAILNATPAPTGAPINNPQP